MSSRLKRGSKKHKSVPKEQIQSKLKNVLPQSIRGSGAKRESKARPSGRRIGTQHSQQGLPNPAQEPLGVPVPVALSAVGRTASQRSNKYMSSRSTRHRAASMASSVSEKGRGEAVLHSGHLKKKGVVNVAWKIRYFVLTNKYLYYYEKDPDAANPLEETAKGQISLLEITSIEKDKKGVKDPTHFRIITPTRIYRLQAYNENGDTRKAAREADGWIGSVAGAVENCKRMNYKPKRRESGSSLEWIKEHEKSIENSVNIGISASSVGGPNEPAQLSNWENWSSFDVAAWLYKVDLSKVYSEVFYENKIDGKKLSEITKSDLADVGVDSEEDKMKILNAVEELRSLSV